MEKNRKNLIVLGVIVSAIVFLLLGRRSLADIFYFLAGIVGISALIRVSAQKRDHDEMKQRMNERIEEIEFRIDKLEKAKEKGNESSS
ncbi:MAG: hypothetical protein A3A65_00260 [Candidatus Chisholmbacteria bacterium RIFCSPLOWO2_01_FULL_49_14]|uniref:Uncharacterized protein n=1 Tax=Candidatus Chisholmbacteria bacterium RIFCSPLOWO2_01_FULL_49_14 TaxID=1797593 RepID=A0A1G1W185_9BACT|nr:MAG: hypothetical protein A3A65_00260 [Candidatus Chisholmbacteria bacterium RIFCSPLOWO2_01_FULL_49_14]